MNAREPELSGLVGQTYKEFNFKAKNQGIEYNFSNEKAVDIHKLRTCYRSYGLG